MMIRSNHPTSNYDRDMFLARFYHYKRHKLLAPLMVEERKLNYTAQLVPDTFNSHQY